jgi:hypothetical protein
MTIKRVLSIISFFIVGQSFAYPLIDRATKTGELKIQVFPDNLVGGLFWYVPTSIEPVVDNGVPMSELYQSRDELLFMFPGQASVDESILSALAQNLGVPRSNLKPIFYNSNKMAVCATDLFDESDVKWMAPERMGNYMEILPFGLRTRNKELIPLFANYFSGKGLGCIYEYEFSAAYTAYKVHVELDLNRIYTRFQSQSHAEGLWWEADIKLLLERLRREGYLRVTQYQDPTASETKLDEQVRAAFDDIIKKVVTMIFTPAVKLQDGEMAGRGKPWSLRMDYRQQAENNHFAFDLESQSVQKKVSTIGVRLGLK